MVVESNASEVPDSTDCKNGDIRRESLTDDLLPKRFVYYVELSELYGSTYVVEADTAEEAFDIARRRSGVEGDRSTIEYIGIANFGLCLDDLDDEAGREMRNELLPCAEDDEVIGLLSIKRRDNTKKIPLQDQIDRLSTDELDRLREYLRK